MAKFEPTYANGLKTPRGRLFWISAFRPDMRGQYATKKYKASCFWPDTEEGRASLKHLRDAAIALAEAQPGWENVPIKSIDLPFRKGDRKVEKYPYLKGQLYLTAKSKSKPTCVGVPYTDDLEEGDLYSGCYGRLSLSLMTYESTEKVRDAATGEMFTQTSRGVTCLLDGIQKLADGDRLGGGGGAGRSVFDDDETASAESEDAFDQAGEIDETAARGEATDEGNDDW